MTGINAEKYLIDWINGMSLPLDQTSDDIHNISNAQYLLTSVGDGSLELLTAQWRSKYAQTGQKLTSNKTLFVAPKNINENTRNLQWFIFICRECRSDWGNLRTNIGRRSII
ncbi:MAG: hypothetical protein HYU98_01115 [Deltaproteobacteria bacterium]|nr:hypothetical protein [Deltaproteobacteria bacterium]